QQFWKAIDEGRTPGLKTAGTGTTSGNCPALAVGNVSLTGSNPPKFLDAAFDRVEVRDATGRFVPVAKGGRITIRGDQAVTATIEIRNLGEAAWLPGQPIQAGSVSLVVSGSQTRSIALPRPVNCHDIIMLESVPLASPGLDRPATIVLFLNAENRSPFGERFSITLAPQAP
ncbi:MAG TPA: hypothetical protein VLM89_11815, partial [Phycisphaerae bacterium]|nr:hypothetical protein [Phycisphaerae bacterium]